MKYTGSCIRCARRFLEGDNRYAKDGLWTMANGGYDLWWEICYDRVPVIGCIDGDVEAYSSEYQEIAERLVKKLGYTNRFGEPVLKIVKRKD